jgi:glycosyltransferase involved in cell wall biosynthesis
MGKRADANRGIGMSRSWNFEAAPIVSSEDLPAQPSADRIKVLHLVTRFIDGAGGNTLLSTVGANCERYEPWVAGAPGGPLWEQAEGAGVRVVKLRRLREVIAPIDDLAVLLDLMRLIRRQRFSVVHTHSSKAGFLGRLAAWLCRTPVIVHTIHGFAFHDFMSRRRRWVYVALERLVRPMTDAFLAVAPQVAREAVELRLAPPGRVKVVPSAVELVEVPPQEVLAIRQRLGIPDDASLVGTVGRLDFQKAPLDFVRMAALVQRTQSEARFIWVGQGELLVEARAEAQRLGVQVDFLGFSPDATKIAACFDVYVVSSLYEGLGRALTEAMASGRPVVATAVNGVVDLVQSGSTGLLAPPADPEALAKNVRWMLQHPTEARRMGEAARTRVRDLFQPEMMCALIEETYAQLLGLPDAPRPSSRRHGMDILKPKASELEPAPNLPASARII